ncbi:transposase InsK for insertion sequence [Streptococcus pneumoniae GA16531]|nr:transposase InsK for insertion sequence [Streptococcus pneumoniae GA16531]
MTEFSLDLLLKAIKLARSTYYYHLKQLDKTDKDQELKAEIQSILSNTREIMLIIGFI